MKIAGGKVMITKSCKLKSKSCSSGFTLVEIIVVVVIIGFAAMMAIPLMSSAGSIQVGSAAEAIAADLEYAKSLAITKLQVYTVVFDTAAESYSILDQGGNVIKHPVKKGFDFIVDFKASSRLDKVDIVDADFDNTSEINFDYLGSPYNGDSPPGPLNSGVITLDGAGRIITINIEPVTGYISVSN